MEWTPWVMILDGLLAVVFVLYVIQIYHNRHEHPMKLGGLLSLLGVALMFVGTLPIAPAAMRVVWPVGCILLAFGALIEARAYRNART